MRRCRKFSTWWGRDSRRLKPSTRRRAVERAADGVGRGPRYHRAGQLRRSRCWWRPNPIAESKTSKDAAAYSWAARRSICRYPARRSIPPGLTELPAHRVAALVYDGEAQTAAPTSAKGALSTAADRGVDHSTITPTKKSSAMRNDHSLFIVAATGPHDPAYVRPEATPDAGIGGTGRHQRVSRRVV